MDKNVTDNQTILREEIEDIKQYLLLIENEVNSSDHVELLSNDQVLNILRKLRTAGNFVYSANHFWAKYTNNKELIEKIARIASW